MIYSPNGENPSNVSSSHLWNHIIIVQCPCVSGWFSALGIFIINFMCMLLYCTMTYQSKLVDVRTTVFGSFITTWRDVVLWCATRNNKVILLSIGHPTKSTTPFPYAEHRCDWQVESSIGCVANTEPNTTKPQRMQICCEPKIILHRKPLFRWAGQMSNRSNKRNKHL